MTSAARCDLVSMGRPLKMFRGNSIVANGAARRSTADLRRSKPSNERYGAIAHRNKDKFAMLHPDFGGDAKRIVVAVGFPSRTRKTHP